ncbi:uncharacterized protein EI90DRAFT_2454947 [Cantharellus anzutake]|uniref:uncharacterized protein n=1 Tax=Cantharellus anzutake TaxID=1750568 RepID=UPI00190600FC|nr:uncharacterized protein EI90DRAFT_2454947 [Cantharellus anzutake]KAF8339073.1 hypothetical protein EI90DRAFT_2454947 [Cantharellus anzutake]
MNILQIPIIDEFSSSSNLKKRTVEFAAEKGFWTENPRKTHMGSPESGHEIRQNYQQRITGPLQVQNPQAVIHNMSEGVCFVTKRENQDDSRDDVPQCPIDIEHSDSSVTFVSSMLITHCASIRNCVKLYVQYVYQFPRLVTSPLRPFPTPNSSFMPATHLLSAAFHVCSFPISSAEVLGLRKYPALQQKQHHEIAVG